MASLQADERKLSARIDVRVTSPDDDVMLVPVSGRACAVASSGAVRSGMPATCSPTVTLLQKRRGQYATGLGKNLVF